METSRKPHRMILFKKKDCAPCAHAMRSLEEVLATNPDFRQHVVVLQKENHPALVASYELEQYPTVLVLDRSVDLIQKVQGGFKMTESWWFEALSLIHLAERDR